MGNGQWTIGNGQQAKENYVEVYLKLKQLSNRKRRTAVVAKRSVVIIDW